MNIIKELQDNLVKNIKQAEDKRLAEVLTQVILSGDLEKLTSSQPITAIKDTGEFTVTHKFDFTYIPYRGQRNEEAKLNKAYDLLNYICEKYKINHNNEREEMEGLYND